MLLAADQPHSSLLHDPVPPVRLFIGNLPYQATEEDLRTHFAAVGEPTQIVRPTRPRDRSRARICVRRIRRPRQCRSRDQAVRRSAVHGPAAGGQRGAGARRSRARRATAAGRRLRRTRVRAAAGMADLGPADPGVDTAARGRAGLVVRHGPAALAARVPAASARPGPAVPAKASGRERNFGPPAPPKGKKGQGQLPAEGTRAQGADPDEVHRPDVRPRRSGCRRRMPSTKCRSS